MAIDMQAESTMMNSRAFKIFLLLYLAARARGLTIIDYQCNFASSLLQCANSSLDISKELDYYTLDLSSNDIAWKITEQFVEYNQECHYSIQLQTGEMHAYIMRACTCINNLHTCMHNNIISLAMQLAVIWELMEVAVQKILLTVHHHHQIKIT